MTTKIKFLILALFVLFSFSLLPQTSLAQNGGICQAAYVDADIGCFALCQQQVDQAECESITQSASSGSTNSISASILATKKANAASCSCLWIADPVGGGGESCNDGIQNQNETGVDTGGVCPPPQYIPPVCKVESFGTVPSPLILPNSNSGTNLYFTLSDMRSGTPVSGVNFDWEITLVGGTNGLPTPRTGYSSGTPSGGITTGSLSSTQVYEIICGNSKKQATVSVAPPVPPPGTPPDSTCDEIDATNYGGALPCVLPTGYVCDDQAATNYGASESCIYPAPPENPYLTPSISAPLCVDTEDTSYTGTITWPTVQNNIRIFVDDDMATPPGFDKVLFGGSGTTPVPSGFSQRMPPPAPAVLTLLPDVEYFTFIQNDSTYDGPVRNWTVPYCEDTNQAIGYLDAPATNGTCPVSFEGWTYDPDYPDDSNSVHFYKDGVFAGAAVAGSYRADLPGDKYHAFGYPIPVAWRDGQDHVIDVYAIDLNGDGNPSLGGSPKVINCPAMSGTLTPATISCAIPNNQSSCDVDLNWTLSNPVGNITKITANGMTDREVSTSLATPQSGTALDLPVPYGTRNFYLYNNGVQLGQTAVATATCSGQSFWDNGVCVWPVCGDGNPEGEEICDLGAAGNGTCPSLCSDSCTTNNCGGDSDGNCDDEIQNGNETGVDSGGRCDDVGEGECGDNTIDYDIGEECDVGDRIEGDGCSALCKLEYPTVGGDECSKTVLYGCNAPATSSNSVSTPGAYTWTCTDTVENPDDIDECFKQRTPGRLPIFIED